MVLGVEDERDGVTDRGVDGIGLVDELAVVTDCHRKICRGDCGGEAGKGNGSEGKMHFECLFEVFRLEV